MNCPSWLPSRLSGLAADVVKFVDRDQPVVERLDPQLIHGKAERRMRAYEHLVVARQELADRLHLRLRDLGSSRARRIAQVPLRLDHPVRPKTECAQLLIGETTADRAFWHDDDRLLQALVLQFVQCDEH